MADSEKPGSALEAVETAAAGATPDESAPEQDDSSSSTTEDTQPQLEAAEPDPTAQADEGTASEPDAEQPEARGPIPYDRHKSVLTKQRKEAQAVQEAVQKEYEDYKARLAWAEQVDQSQYQQRNQLVEELYSDPVAFYQKLARELEAHPHLGPQLKQPDAFEMPEPALRSQDGLPAYTADQVTQILDHKLTTQEAQLAQKFQALEARIEQQAQIEGQRQAQASSYQKSQDIMNRYSGIPQFQENKEAIGKAFAAIPRDHLIEIGAEAAVVEAFNSVLLSKVLPAASKSAKEQTLQTLQKKAAAGTVDPSSVGADAASRPRNARELEKFIRKQAGAA